MLALIAAAALAAAPFSMALPDLNAVKLAPGEGALYSQLLSAKLQKRGVKVITTRDFSAVMGLERQKQLLGNEVCSDSCVTELAAAMGVDAILVGDVGKPGNAYALSFKVLAARDASVLALFSAQVANADLVDAALDKAAWSLLSQLAPQHPGLKPGPEPGLVVVPSASGPRKLIGIIPAALAVVSLGAGVTGLVLASSKYNQLLVAETVPDAQALRSDGKTLQLIGWVGVSVGIAAAVAAAGFFVFGSSAPVTPTASFSSSGGGLGLAGAF